MACYGDSFTLLSNAKHLVFLHSVRGLLVTANVLPSSPILVTLMMEALYSSDTSVLTRATLRLIPEGGILQPGDCSVRAWDKFVKAYHCTVLS
jgi:hypothetical protein